MENSWSSELVLYVERSVFSLKTNMYITEVKLLLKENALCLCHMALALQLFRVAILYLKIKSFFVRLGTLWVEYDFNFQTTSSLYLICKRLRNKCRVRRLPCKSSWCITVVC